MSGGLHFDIDASQIKDLMAELGATEKQAKFALSRALGRTAATLRKMGERGLRSEVDIKKLAYIRKRLKSIGFRRSNFQGTQLWYGLNDMPVSALRGRKKRTAKGAQFAGKAGTKEFAGGFVADSRMGYGRTIFMRKGAARLPLTEAEMPVEDRMVTYIEDEIFTEVETIFWKHFERDMTARAKYGVGATDYKK